MKRPVRRYVLAVCVAFLIAAGSARAEAFKTIDSFDVPDGGQNVSDTTADASAVTNENLLAYSLTEVVGGYRFISINATAVDGDLTGSELEASDPNDDLTLDNPSGFTSIGIVTWDGSGNTGLGGLDLSEWSQIVLGVTDSASTGGSVDIELEDTTNATDNVTKNFGTGAQDLVYPFSSFSGVDVASLDRITMTITTVQTGQDASFDFIRATPEPGMALLLSLVALVAISRRPGRR